MTAAASLPPIFRDLLTRLDLVFMDTTSLYFEGAGGQTLGQHGYSKDHRPDLRQMILAVLLDGGPDGVHGAEALCGWGLERNRNGGSGGHAPLFFEELCELGSFEHGEAREVVDDFL